MARLNKTPLTLRLRRGTEAQITATSPAPFQREGEMAYATDTGGFYVSDGTQFILLANGLQDLQSVTDEGNTTTNDITVSELTATERISLEADSTVTTQTTAVISATDTDSGIAIVPNGTGAITANIPDGTATGGNARGQYAVDLQMDRSTAIRVASGDYSTIVGGRRNTSAGTLSVTGGYNNTANGQGNVAMGHENTTSNAYTIALGVQNNSSSNYSSVSGGRSNTASARSATVVGGESNTSSGQYSIISGGYSNTASSNYATVLGGQNNTASTGTHATVVGGQSNTSSGQYSISGGFNNESSGIYSTSFGSTNTSSGNYSVAMGRSNQASNTSAIALGRENVASGTRSIALGLFNTASSNESAVLGGQSNTASTNTHATVVGGSGNTSSGAKSISGGNGNTSSGAGSVALGYDNNASGTYAFVSGWDNDALETATFVSGARAKAYLRGQKTHSTSRDLSVAGVGQAQMSELLALRKDTLTTAATTVLSLDGTGTTNLIIPDGNNRVWNVTIDTTAVVTAVNGTSGIAVGDVYSETTKLTFKKIGGTSSLVGILSQNAVHDGGMGTATMNFSAGSSQELQIEFQAPSFGAGDITVRVVSKVSLVEVAY
jgi:hypothetical protein